MVHDTPLTAKGDAVFPVCIAFNNATKFTRPFSENHLIFHVREPAHVFSLLIAATSAEGQHSDVACSTVNVKHEHDGLELT